MFRILVCALLISALSVHAWRDANSTWDTVSVTNNDSLRLAYSAPLNLSSYEDCRVILKVRDDSVAGFKSDSICLQWGYQTFSSCLDSAGNYDTAFNVRVILDTCLDDSFGKASLASVNTLGVISQLSEIGNIDTSKVTGFAIQSKWFDPKWDTYIRFWTQGLAGNRRGGRGPVTVFQLVRRVWSAVRDQ